MIAKEILNQLGNNKFLTMTDAKNLLAHEAGLSFKLPARFAKDNINYVKITLNSLDLYDIEYGQVKGFEYKVKKTTDSIYNDMLVRDFETTTGLNTSL